MSFNPLATIALNLMVSAEDTLERIHPHKHDPPRIRRDLDHVEYLIRELHEVKKEGRLAFIGFEEHKDVKLAYKKAQEVQYNLNMFKEHYAETTVVSS